MDTFQLKVISSDRVFYEGRCKQLIIPAPDGQKGILPHHENMIIAVEIGELHLQDEEGNWITASVSKGFAEIMNNRVSVLVNTAESPEEIDVRRATEAKERAQEQLRQKQSIQEYQLSQASLARAMARLRASKENLIKGDGAFLEKPRPLLSRYEITESKPVISPSLFSKALFSGRFSYKILLFLSAQ